MDEIGCWNCSIAFTFCLETVRFTPINTLTKEILIQLNRTCHMNHTICAFIQRKKDYSCISPGIPNFYNIYSFTSSKILTSFGEPDAPGSCLVHTGPAFHASVSPQSQNPPPVELCICKRHKFQL